MELQRNETTSDVDTVTNGATAGSEVATDEMVVSEVICGKLAVNCLKVSDGLPPMVRQ